jgi:hypothetical protein
LELFPYLLVGQHVTPVESWFAAAHRLNEAVFFFEVPCDHVPHDLIGLKPLLRSAVCEEGLEIGTEFHFHTLKRSEKHVPWQSGWAGVTAPESCGSFFWTDAFFPVFRK